MTEKYKQTIILESQIGVLVTNHSWLYLLFSARRDMTEKYKQLFQNRRQERMIYQEPVCYVNIYALIKRRY
jgi:hypothetical protein